MGYDPKRRLRILPPRVSLSCNTRHPRIEPFNADIHPRKPVLTRLMRATCLRSNHLKSRTGATGCPVTTRTWIRDIMNGRLRRRPQMNCHQAEIVAGSILTPGPWVEEIAIFLR